jgi:2-C-methyl-D-erythritol 4-phosphate cytidylyltransferase
MSFVSFLIVAGGNGLRLGAKIPKAFVKVNGKPILEYSIIAAQTAHSVNEIILVKPADYQFKGITYFTRYSKLKAIVCGGKERIDSVRAGLKAVSPKSKIVLIHDAARPLIRPEQIEAVIKMTEKHGAAILAAPVTDTIKRSSKEWIKATVDRSDLWKAQTPQGFKTSIINRTHFAKRRSVTDDSQLAEINHIKVNIVPGNDINLKITTPIDLEVAAWLLKKKNIA